MAILEASPEAVRAWQVLLTSPGMLADLGPLPSGRPAYKPTRYIANSLLIPKKHAAKQGHGWTAVFTLNDSLI